MGTRTANVPHVITWAGTHSAEWGVALSAVHLARTLPYSMTRHSTTQRNSTTTRGPMQRNRRQQGEFMSIRRLSFATRFPRFGIALAIFASALGAQGNGRTLFQWNGRVDREVQITMRGREAWVQAGGTNERRLATPSVSSALPQENGTVTVRLEDGRGDARVIQQPSRQNDYTAIVRLTDRSGGADSYRVTAFWSGAYGRDDQGTWDNGRGRDQDRNGGYNDNGGYDRGRNDNGGYDRGRNDRGRDNSDYGWGNGRNGSADQVLRWSGQVDDGLEIRIQGNRIDYRRLSGKGTRDVRADFARGGLPRANAQIVVREREGRGQVDVVQQPSARNNYTAVIRIYDPQPSYGYYDFQILSRGGNGYGWGIGGSRR